MAANIEEEKFDLCYNIIGALDKCNKQSKELSYWIESYKVGTLSTIREKCSSTRDNFFSREHIPKNNTLHASLLCTTIEQLTAELEIPYQYELGRLPEYSDRPTFSEVENTLKTLGEAVKELKTLIDKLPKDHKVNLDKSYPILEENFAIAKSNIQESKGFYQKVESGISIKKA